jgi:hypothetical protein
MAVIEVRPRLLSVLFTNYAAFLSSTVLFTIWKWILDWPAPWISLLLLARATFLSLLHFPRLTLRLEGRKITGPSGATLAPSSLNIDHGFNKVKFFGLTILEDSQGNKVNYRESWYPKAALSTFNRRLARLTKSRAE